jgi:hypothetical protein
MEINLDSKKSIKYNLLNLDKVTKVNLIISFSNNVEYKFECKVDVENNEVSVELPILNNMIKNEVSGQSYLEIFSDVGKYYKTEREDVKFYHSTTIDVKFNEDNDQLFETVLLNEEKPTIEMNMKNVKTRKLKNR